jgi:hypothetical protein
MPIASSTSKLTGLLLGFLLLRLLFCATRKSIIKDSRAGYILLGKAFISFCN